MNTRCQVGQQAASEAEAGAVKAAPAGTEKSLETKLRDIYAVMFEACVLHDGGYYEAHKKDAQARRLMGALIEEVKAK